MIAAVLRNEIAKTVRTKLPYFGVVAVCVVCALTFFSTDALGNSEDTNGWDFVGFAMQIGFTDVGLIFTAIFSALLLAEETGSGTIRTALSTPVLRREFFVAKVLMGLIYMVVLYTAALLVATTLGAFRYEFGDVSDEFGLIYGKKEVLINFAVAFFLGWVPMSAVVLFGVFVSAVTRRGGQAIGVVIGMIALVEAAKYFVGIGPYVFTTYLGAPWVIFHELAQGVPYEWFPQTWKIIAVPTVYCVVLFAAGLLMFSRRDLND